MELLDSNYLVPALIPILIVALLALMLAVWKRGGFIKRNSNDDGHVYSTFLPPIINGNLPKEETYIVPRDWRPTTLGSTGVYAPLSIPIQEPQKSTLSWGQMGATIIHALPPKSGPHPPAYL